MAARKTPCRGDSTFTTVLGAVTVWMVLGAWLAAPASADLTDYAVFGDASVTTGADWVINGSVGSNTSYVALGLGTVVTGDTDKPAVPSVAMTLGSPPEFGSTMYGTTDVWAGGVLAPGSYRWLALGGNETLSLTSGDYYFSYFSAGDNLTLNLDLESGYALRIYVSAYDPEGEGGGAFGTFAVGDGLAVNLVGGAGDAGQVFVQIDGGFTLGDSGTWLGTVYAPNEDLEDSSVGLISIGSGFSVTGALYGNTVSMGDGGVVTGMPYDPSTPIIPAPGALALGMVGLGLVGWLRRRF